MFSHSDLSVAVGGTDSQLQVATGGPSQRGPLTVRKPDADLAADSAGNMAFHALEPGTEGSGS